MCQVRAEEQDQHETSPSREHAGLVPRLRRCLCNLLLAACFRHAWPQGSPTQSCRKCDKIQKNTCLLPAPPLRQQEGILLQTFFFFKPYQCWVWLCEGSLSFPSKLHFPTCININCAWQVLAQIRQELEDWRLYPLHYPVIEVDSKVAPIVWLSDRE